MNKRNNMERAVKHPTRCRSLVSWSRSTKEAVLENLVKEIEKKGTACRRATWAIVLFQTLADNGLNEVMYKMHNHRRCRDTVFNCSLGLPPYRAVGSKSRCLLEPLHDGTDTRVVL